ncbi:MAG: hypothetical protein HW382_460 [Deltaproteobacteria bacterium]|nr:hypothetical protein [Deltaproteobacteria bacterium]MBM2838130.1 hypothetical protein [Deltaproteobacteria bacterium]
MPKKNKEKEEVEKAGRVGVPPVREAYQEIKGIKKVEDEAVKRERIREEKVHEHLEYEKAKGYGGHLPPAKNRINVERPPFKKK